MVEISAHHAYAKSVKSAPAHIRKKADDFLQQAFEMPSPLDIKKIKNVKILSSAKGWYRIRFGNYRLGFFLDEDNKRLVARFIGSRGDFYKHFPPKD